MPGRLHVGVIAQMAHVRCIEQVKIAILTAPDDKIFSRNQEWAGRCEVDVTFVQRSVIRRSMPVLQTKVAAKFEEGLTKVTFSVPGSVSSNHVDVPGAISRRPVARLPDSRLAVIRTGIEDSDLIQSGGIVGHRISGIQAMVAVTGEGDVDGVVRKQETRPLILIHGTEVGGRDCHRTSGLICSRRNPERVQEVTGCAVHPGLRHDVEGVGAGIDNGRTHDAGSG